MSRRISALVIAWMLRYCAAVVAQEGSNAAVEIGSHSLQSANKRLMRSDVGPKSDSLLDNSMESDASLGSILDRTIRTLHYQQSNAARATGPGLLPVDADPWTSSLGAMQNLSHSVRFDCSESYGARMLDKLMDGGNAHHLCSGKSSTITCHERVPFDVPRYMCELKNVLISQEGTTVTGCQKSGDFDSFVAKQGITEQNIFGKYTKNGGLKFETGSLPCGEHPTRPALVQVPTNTENFYEWYGDWVTLWETLAALKWNPQDVDLYLVGSIGDPSAGHQFKRPFDEAWSRAFKEDSIHTGSYKEVFGTGTCFDHIVTVPQGALSTISFAGGRGGTVSCLAPTVLGSALFLQALFRDSLTKAAAAAKPAKKVTLLLRKGLREFKNEAAEIAAVKEVLPSDWTFQIYRAEEVQDLTVQLEVAASTQVWVGVHGAGMMHELFLPPKARVVEIFCQDRPRENHHYRNLMIMGEPAVGPHLFSYYFDSWQNRCQVDSSQVAAAIKAYDANPASSLEFSLSNVSPMPY